MSFCQYFLFATVSDSMFSNYLHHTVATRSNFAPLAEPFTLIRRNNLKSKLKVLDLEFAVSWYHAFSKKQWVCCPISTFLCHDDKKRTLLASLQYDTCLWLLRGSLAQYKKKKRQTSINFKKHLWEAIQSE